LKISVVTVTRNCASVVEDCLVSVAEQSYPDVAHVVIDGASTDGTLALLQAQHERLALLVSEPDQGIYDAMNKGIKFASGDVVGFLNSDDFYANVNVLARVAEIFEEDPLLDACYGDLIYTNQIDTSITVRYWQSSDLVPGAFSKGWCPPHPTFFLRRSVYKRFGNFDLKYRIASDVELMMRFLEVHKIRARYVPEVWVKMRMGGTTNKSLKNVWMQNQEILRALHSHGLPANPIRFLGNKLLSRGSQFFQRPSV
jgi:glycosyltransferase involved in cell wall biosynthesis